MDIKEIVIACLKANGYDGLCNGGIECGCAMDDLLICGTPDMEDCVPAYLIEDDRCEDCEDFNGCLTADPARKCWMKEDDDA